MKKHSKSLIKTYITSLNKEKVHVSFGLHLINFLSVQSGFPRSWKIIENPGKINFSRKSWKIDKNLKVVEKLQNHEKVRRAKKGTKFL